MVLAMAYILVYLSRITAKETVPRFHPATLLHFVALSATIREFSLAKQGLKYKDAILPREND